MMEKADFIALCWVAFVAVCLTFSLINVIN